MDDLISRQSAIEAVGYYSLHSGDKLLFADKPLKELPSAQPTVSPDMAQVLAYECGKAERKHGKWVLHPEVKNIYGGIYIECSECHTKYVVQHIEDEKYCRNCGADMRKGEEE